MKIVKKERLDVKKYMEEIKANRTNRSFTSLQYKNRPQVEERTEYKGRVGNLYKVNHNDSNEMTNYIPPYDVPRNIYEQTQSISHPNYAPYGQRISQADYYMNKLSQNFMHSPPQVLYHQNNLMNYSQSLNQIPQYVRPNIEQNYERGNYRSINYGLNHSQAFSVGNSLISENEFRVQKTFCEDQLKMERSKSKEQVPISKIDDDEVKLEEITIIDKMELPLKQERHENKQPQVKCMQEPVKPIKKKRIYNKKNKTVNIINHTQKDKFQTKSIEKEDKSKAQVIQVKEIEQEEQKRNLQQKLTKQKNYQSIIQSFDEKIALITKKLLPKSKMEYIATKFEDICQLLDPSFNNEQSNFLEEYSAFETDIYRRLAIGKKRK